MKSAQPKRLPHPPHVPYNPAHVEAEQWRRWEQAKAFTPPPRARGESFVMMLPPPNITGELHMGHALNAVLQDVLARARRMQGRDVLWLPGTDHAGIAAQNVVERQLQKEGKTRQQLGREGFLRRMWVWKEEYGRRIVEQLKALGSSCDWSRERFTLDSEYIRAVEEAFLHYARRGLIYRGVRPVNWCLRCSSVISDLEVEYQQRRDELYYLRYPLAEGEEKTPPKFRYVEVATVRPETMLGDTAVAVHPQGRWKALVGKKVILPLVGRSIPVIADETVDPEFGTGAVKVTPAHDLTDAEIARRHNLPQVQVIDEEGRMLAPAAGEFARLTVQQARQKIVRRLRAEKVLVREEPYAHSVGMCSRCGTTIEILPSKQWFLRMQPLGKLALQALEQDLPRFHPPRWRRIYRQWLEQVEDWCISRQLWWGHRLPVWWCTQCSPGLGREKLAEDEVFVFSSRRPPDACKKCGKKKWKQEPDVLDTWFSSALWPFATLGWPQRTADLKRFYPTHVLVTAPDILYLWVARMVFSGLELLAGKRSRQRALSRRIPFRDVILHATIQNLRGQRMSKSLGTGVDPMELVERHGADATRLSLLLLSAYDQQALRFDPRQTIKARNFMNKLWNMAKLVRRLEDKAPQESKTREVERWMSSRLGAITREVTDLLEQFRLGEAARLLYRFTWDEFADWYLEFAKFPELVASQKLREHFLHLLMLWHPFIPFISEHLWQQLGEKDLLMLHSWPSALPANASAEEFVRGAQEIVSELRRIKAPLGVRGKWQVMVYLGGAARERYYTLLPALARLAGVREIAAETAEDIVELARGKDWVLGLPLRALSARAVMGGLSRLRGEEVKLSERLRQIKRRLRTMRDRAPEMVIIRTSAEQERLEKQKRELAKLREQLLRISKQLSRQ
jgi:valyl-tRNA synthetase